MPEGNIVELFIFIDWFSWRAGTLASASALGGSLVASNSVSSTVGPAVEWMRSIVGSVRSAVELVGLVVESVGSLAGSVAGGVD